jgi:hypothetical protein
LRFILFLRDFTATVATVVTCSWVGGILATNGRTDQALMKPVLLAILCVLVAFLPGIVMRMWVFQGVNRFLAALAWRFSAGLGALALAFAIEAVERKTFIGALLPCYFATLLLESWLETKQAQLPVDR